MYICIYTHIVYYNILIYVYIYIYIYIYISNKHTPCERPWGRLGASAPAETLYIYIYIYREI